MKKYLRYTVILFFLFTIILHSTNAKNHFALFGKIIVIDSGHGGLDPGTLYGDIYEKNINLEISKVLKTTLEKMGATVILTRSGDYDLSKPGAIYRKKSDFDNRIKIINNSNADLYLSIHLNYLNDSSYFGTQVFYGDKKLAKSITNAVNTSREIKTIPSNTYMYSKLKIKGVLIECGFLSNSSDRKKLQSKEYQEKLSQNIALGIINYFNS